MLWQIIAILSGLVFAVTNVLDKYTLNKLVSDPALNVLSQVIIVGFAVLIAIFHGLVPISLGNLLLALIAGALESLSILLYFHAAKMDEISRVLPVWYFDTVFIAIFAVFLLNEIFAPSTYFGIALLLLGIIIIGMRKIEKPKITKATAIMLAASFIMAISAVIVKYLLGFGDYLSILAYMLFGYTIILLPLLILKFRKVVLLIQKNKKGVAMLVTKESVTVFATALYVFAASMGPITLVNALSSLQPLFLLGFAVVASIFYPKILHEEIRGANLEIKIASIILILLGAYLIAL